MEVLALEKGAFTQLLGPVRDVLSRQMRTRVLKSVPVLATLSDADLDLVRVCSAACICTDMRVVLLPLFLPSDASSHTTNAINHPRQR